MKKLAFCFLIYDKINSEKLWDNFFKNIDKNKYNIYIHYKKNYQLKFFENFKLKKCLETKWGDISLVYAQNLLLKEALKDKDNQHFILISQACIPLKNFNHIYNFLNTNFSYFNVFPHKDCFPRCNYLLNFIDKQYVQKSSQWWILNRQHANLFINDKTLEWYQDIRCPEEHYYITYLSMNNLQNELINTYNESNNATTFVNWKGLNYKYESEGGLKNYNSITKEELIYLIKNSKCLFGRKFNEKFRLISN